MLKVGLTGGIGSGKSTVARIFETLGIPVYYADDAAKSLMNEDVALKLAISRVFGEASYKNGELDRGYLSSRVFNNVEELRKLNALVHPVVIKHGEDWMLGQSAPYAIKEAALFFETGSAGSLDYMIGVSAPNALRVHRVMQRDGVTREAVLARMQKQISETIKMRLCDSVIFNDEQQLVMPQVLALHEKLLQFAL